MPEKPLTGLEKAAVLLKNLPEEVVGKVLRHMAPRQADRLKAELAHVARRSDLNALMARVLDEAIDVLNTNPNPAPIQAKPAPVETPGPAKVDIRVGAEEPAKAPASLAEESKPLLALAAIPPEILARALENENARTIALLMNSLEIDLAGQIYKRLSPDKRKEVSTRFTEQTTVNELLLNRIAQAVLAKCRTLDKAPPTGTEAQAEKEKRIAGLLRGLDRPERIEMLATLEQSDAALTARVKAMLYQFEDILRMENVSIQKLLSEIDMKTLAFALRGAAEEIQERITGNLSRRAQESLKEEMELNGTVAIAKVREARKSIEDAIVRLDQRDELVMKDKE